MKVTAVVAERRTEEGESTGAALKLQEVELADELLDKEVLVRVVACGICRADLDCVAGRLEGRQDPARRSRHHGIS